MTSFDYIVLAIIGFSTLLSVMRGAIRELMALGSWVVAFWAAQHFTPLVSVWLPEHLPSENIRFLAAFVMVFISTLLGLALVTIAVSGVVHLLGLGTFDRLLGVLFGIVRGAVAVTVLVLLAGLTSLPQHGAWRNAMFSPPFEAAALWVKDWLPTAMAQRIHYE